MNRVSLCSFLVLLLLSPLVTQAQNVSVGKIKNPGDRSSKKCKRYSIVERRIPVEEHYFIMESDGWLYLVITDEKYYDQLFQKRNDGFAIDVIKREQYTCGKANELDSSWAYEGTLLPPVFKKKFRKDKYLEGGRVYVPYGKLPSEFDPANVEFNLIVLQKKWHCDYIQYTSYQDQNWTLLPMGLYRDSLPSNFGNKFHDLKKLYSFSISFDKEEFTIDPVKTKPLYDSLDLTDYVIREIRINAYASVEGSLSNNIRLQEARAQSIVNALQAYQNEKVISKVSARENWNEFYRDVINTPFAHLASLSKDEVKQSLNTDKALLDRLQPILSRHRKADIDIKLEKRLTTETDDPEMLKQYFKFRIDEKNVEEALFIQQEIFRKIKNQRLPEDFIGELEIPRSVNHASLLNNELIFKNEQRLSGLDETLNQFLELTKIAPDRPKLQYNVIALKLRYSLISGNTSVLRDIESRLKTLETSGLIESMVARLTMNFNILRANYYNKIKSYKRKNDVLTKIYNTYRKTHLTDPERLSLAMYMAYYYRLKEGKEILQSRANKKDTSDDLLFYYLSLVLANPGNEHPESLANLLEQATNRDAPRFCELLLPIPQGGVSFQRLENPIIKRFYCQACLN